MAIFIPYIVILSAFASPSPQINDNIDRARNRVKAAQSWVKETVPEKELKLFRVAGDGEIGKGTCLMIHGIFDDYQSVAKLAQAYGKKLGSKNVYSLSYNWSDTSEKAALYIAKELSKLDYEECKKSMVIIGHSRGVLVVRYLIEVLRFSIPFKTAILLCGPNEGSKKDWLVRGFNKAYSKSPVAQELASNGAFLNQLNTQMTDRALIDYILVAASEDNLVSVDSALAKNVRLQQRVMGRIRRVIFDGTHGDVKTSDYQIRQVLAVSLKRDDLETIELATPTTTSLGPDRQWQIPMKIFNTLSDPLIVDDIAIDQFDKNGKWLQTNWGPFVIDKDYEWCNEKYVATNISLPPSGFVKTTLFVDSIPKIGPDKVGSAAHTTITCLITIRYHNSKGRIGQQTNAVVCYSEGSWPEVNAISYKNPSWDPRASVFLR